MDFFEQEVIYKKKVNVTCDTGYFATGRLEIECLKDGTWSKAECRNGTYGIKPSQSAFYVNLYRAVIVADGPMTVRCRFT